MPHHASSHRLATAPHAVTAALMLVCGALVFLSGCGEDAPGCEVDTDCRGERICVARVCQDPASSGTNNSTSSGNNAFFGSNNAVSTNSGTTSTNSATTSTNSGTTSTNSGTTSTNNGTIIEPDTGVPDADAPDTDVSPPDADEPDADVPPPDTDVPDADAPDADAPDADVPDADVGEPDAEPDTPLEEGPQVVVAPEAIDFGEVGQFVSVFEEVVVRNVGDEPLEVRSVELESSPSQGFQVLPPSDAPDALEPGEEVAYRVRFRPTALQGDPTSYGNAVLVNTNDAETPEIRVPLEGLATANPEVCLSFTGNTLDFGFVPPGDVAAEETELVNCGEEPVEVERIDFDGPSAGLGVTFGPELPTVIEPGERFTVVVTYAPSDDSDVDVSLVAESPSGSAEIRVTAGAPCPDAVALLAYEDDNFPSQDQTRGFVGGTFTFSGEFSEDPAGGDLEYTWTLEAPPESQDAIIDPDLQTDRFTLVPDVPGRYDLTLSVRSTLTGREACAPDTVTAFVVTDAPAAEVSVTWDNLADLDLHIVRSDESGESFAPFGSSGDVVEDDVYFANPTPDFGVLGDPTDDPWFQGDDRNGFGPETTLMAVLEEGRAYRIGVNYAQRNFTQRANATVTLTFDGEDPQEFQAEWSDTGIFWVPIIFTSDREVIVVDTFEER